MIVVTIARKPFTGSVVPNLVRHSTGGLDIERCRIVGKPRTTHTDGNYRTRNDGPTMHEGFAVGMYSSPEGRWPSNLILSKNQEVLEEFPETHSTRVNLEKGQGKKDYKASGYHIGYAGRACRDHADMGGSATRFFKQV